MWCVVMTETGICMEAHNPAHVEVETYEKEHEAQKAIGKMFAGKVCELSGELAYCEYTEREARVLGEMAVVVIAMMKLPDPTGAKKEPA